VPSGNITIPYPFSNLSFTAALVALLLSLLFLLTQIVPSKLAPQPIIGHDLVS